MTLTLGDASEIPRNGRRFYTVNGESIAVLDVDGKLYAIRNTCPHMGGPVGEGKVFGKPSASQHVASRFASFTPDDGTLRRPRADEAAAPAISCPLHGWEFDLADGTPRFPAKRGLKTYPVWIEDGLVKLDPGTEEEPPLAMA
ncbi:Rieske (2Fe-2S) protein [Halalkalicoccus ordinarius]|uniref:Rieske (2Fe-2S) protein n=1 Tax=Halalkalicoccus ordinarius TaxID=3116651 RepID=UPI00300E7A77